jgi:hypothetical protein
MDLWVVKYASRRSRIGDFRALPWPEVPGSGRFGLSGECRPKEAVGSGSGTGWEGVVGRDQASWNRSEALAAARGGAPGANRDE